MKQYRVAILGASGAVGQEMMKILAERKFPVGELHLLASARSAGKVVSWQGQDIVVEEATDAAFAGMDIVLGAAENDIAERFAPAIVRSGAVFVDNAGDVKLHHGIISNPNCSTIITLTAINALRKLSPIRDMVVSTYQAVSGAGAGGPIELQNEVDALRAGKTYAPKVFAGHERGVHLRARARRAQPLHLRRRALRAPHLRGRGARGHRRRPRLPPRGRSRRAAVPHAARHVGSGPRVRRPHPPRPDRPQRPVPLVLRRPGAQGRGHQLPEKTKTTPAASSRSRRGSVLRYMAAGSAPLRKRRGCGIRRIQYTAMAGEPDD